METPLILNPQYPADSAIIWLHGLGATKHDFEPVAQLLQQYATPTTRYILPQAPIQPVTLNGGAPMPSWYDIVDLNRPTAINPSDFKFSAQIIIDLIEAERAAGIPLERILLAGFSQGGAIALHTAFIAYDQAVAGVMALSTYAPTLSNHPLDAMRQTIPTLHLHGIQDPVVKLTFGKEAYETLLAQGVEATWHQYTMQHEVIEEEIHDIAQWLMQRLPALEESAES